MKKLFASRPRAAAAGILALLCGWLFPIFACLRRMAEAAGDTELPAWSLAGLTGTVFSSAPLIIAGILTALLTFVMFGTALNRMAAEKIAFKVSGFLLALFFTFNTVFVMSGEQPDHLVLLPALAQRWVNALVWLVLTAAYYLTIELLCCLLRHPRKPEKGTDASACWMFLYAGILFVCWLGVYLVKYPGGIGQDSVSMILQTQGWLEMDASFPVLTSLIFGGVFSLGQLLGGDTLGLVFLCVFNGLTLALALGALCREIRRDTGSLSAAWVLCLFFAAFPYWGGVAVDGGKDIPHTACFLCFLMFYRRVLRGEKGNFFRLILFAVLACATRKAAVYLVAGGLLVLCFVCCGKKRILAIASVVCILGGHFAVGNALYPALDIWPADEKENYSLLYQTTAYYCQTHEEELDEDDVHIIKRFLDYDALWYAYDTEKSDGIKDTYRAEEPEDTLDFLLLNARFLLKHPATYAEGLIRVRYKYYEPFESCAVSTHIATPATMDCDTDWEIVPHTEARTEKFASMNAFLTETPVIRALTAPGLYVWGLLVLLAALIQRRDGKAVLALVPLLLLMCGLLMTHVNGAARYAYPLTMAVPFAWVLAAHQRKELQETPKAE